MNTLTLHGQGKSGLQVELSLLIRWPQGGGFTPDYPFGP